MITSYMWTVVFPKQWVNQWVRIFLQAHISSTSNEQGYMNKKCFFCIFSRGTTIATSSFFAYVPHAHVLCEKYCENLPRGNIHGHIFLVDAEEFRFPWISWQGHLRFYSKIMGILVGLFSTKIIPRYIYYKEITIEDTMPIFIDKTS